MIVDDNVFERNAFKGMFDQYQFECDLALRGLEALEMVQVRFSSGQQMYQLIMIDYKMPETDGCELAIMILNFLKEMQSPEAKLPYIVCITSFMNRTIK